MTLLVLAQVALPEQWVVDCLDHLARVYLSEKRRLFDIHCLDGKKGRKAVLTWAKEKGHPTHAYKARKDVLRAAGPEALLVILGKPRGHYGIRVDATLEKTRVTWAVPPEIPLL